MKLKEYLSLNVFSIFGNIYLLFCIFVLTEFFALNRFSSLESFLKLLHLEFIFPSLENLFNIFSIFLVLHTILFLLLVMEFILNVTSQNTFQLKNNFHINKLFFNIGFLFNCIFSILFLYFIFKFKNYFLL